MIKINKAKKAASEYAKYAVDKNGKICGDDRKKAFEALGSELWLIKELSAADVRCELELLNDNLFEPSFDVNKFNNMCYGFFTAFGKNNPELWNRDFPFVIVSENNYGGTEYKVDFKLLAAYVIKKGHYFFVGDLIYLYDNDRGVYKKAGSNVFRGYVMGFVDALSRSLAKTSGIDGAVKDILSDKSHIVDFETLDADINLINFKNGLLDLKTMELLPHSPDVRTTVQINCEWNSDAEDCPVFNSFLDTLLNGNDEAISFLWQYMGLALSNIPGYKTKKALILYGKGDTGKSQYYELLQRLLGNENCCSTSMNELEERFGTSALFGKRLAGDADMKALHIKELSIFKKLTGGDLISFEFKGKDLISGRYKGILLFCCNNLPKFGGDKGEHVYERMVILRCDNVIPLEKRDPLLIEKLFAEREGIVFNAVMFLKQFIDNGYKFDVPESSKKEIEKYIVENDNVMQFLNECTVKRERAPRTDDPFTCANMYRAYVKWVTDSGLYKCGKNDFVKSACDFYKVDDVEKIRIKKGNSYYWFTLKSDCHSLCYFPNIEI